MTMQNREDSSSLVTNLRYASVLTPGSLEIALRLDMSSDTTTSGAPRLSSGIVRARLYSGSDIRSTTSSNAVSAICIIRVIGKGMESDQLPSCSTPLKKGCTSTFSPHWDFECGFFVPDIGNGILEISVWDAAVFGSRKANWERTDEYKNYIHGCLSKPYLGTSLIELKHEVDHKSKTVYKELLVVRPSASSLGLPAVRRIQASVRRCLIRATYIDVVHELLSDLRCKITVQAGRNLPSLSDQDDKKGPTTFCKVQVLDTYSSRANGVQWLDAKSGKPVVDQAVSVQIANDFNPVWRFDCALQARSNSNWAVISVQVMTKDDSSEYFVGEALIFKEDLKSESAQGWQKLRDRHGKILMGGRRPWVGESAVHVTLRVKSEVSHGADRHGSDFDSDEEGLEVESSGSDSDEITYALPGTVYGGMHCTLVPVVWDPERSSLCKFPVKSVAQATSVWSYERNHGSAAVSYFEISSALQAYQMRVRILKATEEIMIGLVRPPHLAHQHWGKSTARGYIWWYEAVSGHLFNGDEMLKQVSYTGKQAHIKDIISVTVDLGFNGTQGRITFRKNGKMLGVFDDVKGPLRLAVQLFDEGDMVEDASGFGRRRNRPPSPTQVVMPVPEVRKTVRINVPKPTALSESDIATDDGEVESIEGLDDWETSPERIAYLAKVRQEEEMREALKKEIMEQEYKLAKLRFDRMHPPDARGKLGFDHLIAKPKTVQDEDREANMKRREAISRRATELGDAQERLEKVYRDIERSQKVLNEMKIEERGKEMDRAKEQKLARTELTAALRLAAQARVDKLDIEVNKCRVRQETSLRKIAEGQQKAAYIESIIKRLTEVVGAMTHLDELRTKDDEVNARKLRHSQGIVSPIYLQQSFRSPGRHVYDRFQIRSEWERGAVALEGRNPFSEGITPLLDRVKGISAAGSGEPEIPGALIVTPAAATLSRRIGGAEFSGTGGNQQLVPHQGTLQKTQSSAPSGMPGPSGGPASSGRLAIMNRPSTAGDTVGTLAITNGTVSGGPDSGGAGALPSQRTENGQGGAARTTAGRVDVSHSLAVALASAASRNRITDGTAAEKSVVPMRPRR